MRCFSEFAKEGREIKLDDTVPGYMERGRIDAIVGTPKMEPVTVIASPRQHSRASINGVNGASGADGGSGVNGNRTPSSSTSPVLLPTPPAKAKRRKQPRIVDLGEDDATSSGDRSPTSQHSPRKQAVPVPDVAVERGGSGEIDTLPNLPPITRPQRMTTTSSLGRHTGSRRRARVSASVYEPASPPSMASSPRKADELQFASEAEAFRAKVEALRTEMGDRWLNVLAQGSSLAST